MRKIRRLLVIKKKKQPSKQPEAVENVGSIKPAAGKMPTQHKPAPSTNNIIKRECDGGREDGLHGKKPEAPPLTVAFQEAGKQVVTMLAISGKRKRKGVLLP